MDSHQYPIGKGGSCDGLAARWVDKGYGISIRRTVSIRHHGLRKSTRRSGGNVDNLPRRRELELVWDLSLEKYPAEARNFVTL